MGDEQTLVERAKTDQQAFGKLFDMHYETILSYSVRRVGDLQTGQDITSIVFIKAWNNLPAYEWRNVPFSAWLYRIASNEIQTHFRKEKHIDNSLDELFEQTGFELPSDYDIQEELVAYEDQLERHKDFVLVQSLLRTLPTKYQEVLALRYFEKKSLQDIAVITGKNLNTIKSLLARGTGKLIKEFEAKKQQKTQLSTRKDVI